MTCGFDLGCHVSAWFFGLIGAVPLWAWLLLGILFVGIVWKLAGWPGLVALGAVAGFILGRREEPIDPDYEDGGDRPIRKPRRTAKREPAKGKSLIERLTGRPE